MKRNSLLTALSLLLAATVSAQEPADTPAREDREDAQDEVQAPRRQIRVLNNPYEIASFYRSNQGSGLFGGDASDRYPIAGFYRARAAGPYGYSQFWSTGYGERSRGGIGLGYRRSIGQNGELYLFAPAFLAPVGPLTGAFFFDDTRSDRHRPRR